jgi:hypothetical protein
MSTRNKTSEAFAKGLGGPKPIRSPEVKRMTQIEVSHRPRVWQHAWLVTILLLLALPLGALAQGRTQLYLLPPGGQVTTGEPVAIEVIAEGVSNLYGAEIHLRFDPALVQLQDSDPQADGVQLTPGSLLDTSQGFVVANEIDNQAGTAVFAVTLVNPAPAVEGGGVVAQVTLMPLQPGPLRIELESAKLVTKDLQTLDVSLSGLEVPVSGQSLAPSSSGAQTNPDGTSANTGAASGLPIWALMLMALILVGVPLAGVWFMFNQRNHESHSQSGNHPAKPA